MKKIIFVTGGLVSGGAERVLSTVSTGLSKRGYDVSIISKQRIPPFYELAPSVKVLFPNQNIEYGNHLKKFLSRFRVYVDIYKTIKKEKPNVVIPFSTTTNGVTILICLLQGKVVIPSEHNNYKVGLNKFPIWFIKRILYKFANNLFVLTKRDADNFYGKFLKNVSVMPNPLSLKPTKKLNFDNNEKIILAVGNVSRWYHKGFDNLLRIFHEVHSSLPNVKLQIIGGGDPSYLINLSKQLGIENKIDFITEVKNIQDYYQKASMFVLTSRWEGLPMVLIEAMSQGLPCIAYDCFSGPSEVIENNVDGVLIDNQNISKFTANILALFNDKSKKLLLSNNAVKKSENYNLGIILDKWERVLTKY